MSIIFEWIWEIKSVEDIDTINLDSKEKELLKKFLSGRKDIFKKTRVVFAREKLKWFLKSLETPDKSDEEKIFKKEKKETITTEELFYSDNFWSYTSELNKLDDISYKTFFWENWMFNNLSWLSEDAKRNFVTWINFFITKKILFWIEKWEQKGNIKEFFINILNWLFTSENKLKEKISRFNIVFDSIWQISSNNTWLWKDWRGINNEIFMNPVKAETFFDKLYNWEKDVNKLIEEWYKWDEYILSLSEEDKNVIKQFQYKRKEILWDSTLNFDSLLEKGEELKEWLQEYFWNLSPRIIEIIMSFSWLRDLIPDSWIDLDSALTDSYSRKIKETLIGKFSTERKKEDGSIENIIKINRKEYTVNSLLEWIDKKTINNLKDIKYLSETWYILRKDKDSQEWEEIKKVDKLWTDISSEEFIQHLTEKDERFIQYLEEEKEKEWAGFFNRAVQKRKLEMYKKRDEDEEN